MPWMTRSSTILSGSAHARTASKLLIVREGHGTCSRAELLAERFIDGLRAEHASALSYRTARGEISLRSTVVGIGGRWSCWGEVVHWTANRYPLVDEPPVPLPSGS